MKKKELEKLRLHVIEKGRMTENDMKQIVGGEDLFCQPKTSCDWYLRCDTPPGLSTCDDYKKCYFLGDKVTCQPYLW